MGGGGVTFKAADFPVAVVDVVAAAAADQLALWRSSLSGLAL